MESFLLTPQLEESLEEKFNPNNLIVFLGNYPNSLYLPAGVDINNPKLALFITWRHSGSQSYDSWKEAAAFAFDPEIKADNTAWLLASMTYVIHNSYGNGYDHPPTTINFTLTINPSTRQMTLDPSAYSGANGYTQYYSQDMVMLWRK